MKRIPFKFIPIKRFSWHRDDIDKFMGEYHPGMSYNCTMEARHDMLFIECQKWMEEGLIKIKPLVDESFITLNFGDKNGNSA